MKDEQVAAIVDTMHQAGIDFVTSLPSGAFRLIIPALNKDPRFTHVPVCNERHAIGICTGAWLAGKKPALLAESTGFILSLYDLVSTERLGSIPILLILDNRGDFYEGGNEGRAYFYYIYGKYTRPMLDTLRIPHATATTFAECLTELHRGHKTVEASARPAAVLLSGVGGPGW